MCEELLITPDTFYNHGNSYATFFGAIDQGDGYVSPADLASIATTSDQAILDYLPTFVAQFGNGAGQAIDISNILPDSTITASSKAIVTNKVTLSGISPSALSPMRRAEITALYTNSPGVAKAQVAFRRVAAAGRRRILASRRALQTSYDTEVEAVMFVADEAAAATLAATIPTTAADMGALPAFTGLTIGAVSLEATETWDPPFTGLGVMLVVLILLGIFLCVAASVCSKRARNKAQVASMGCCKTGCCSYFAVKTWAFGELTACVCILIGVAMMYSAVGPLQDAIVGAADSLYTLLNTDTSALPDGASDFLNAIPTGAANSVLDQRSLLAYFRFAVIGPGLLCVFFLLFAALCPCIPRKPGSFCCTKLFILLSYVFLLVALIFYIIFTVIPLGLKYAPEEVQEQIRSITSICVATPLGIEQLITDNTLAVEQLTDAGLDTSSFTDLLSALTSLSGSLTGVCGFTLDALDALNGLFLPGTVCFVSIGFAMYINMSLCCAAGCCCAPKAGGNKVADLSVA